MTTTISQQKEHCRLALLRILDTNRTRFGLQLPALTTLLVSFSIHANEDELLDQLDYLQQKGLVEEVAKFLTRENRAWRITSAGIAHLDSHGL